MADNILQQRKEQKNTPCFPIKKMADSILQQRKTLYVFPKRKWPTIFCKQRAKEKHFMFSQKENGRQYSTKSKYSREITTFLFSLLNY